MDGDGLHSEPPLSGQVAYIAESLIRRTGGVVDIHHFRARAEDPSLRSRIGREVDVATASRLET